MKESIKLVIEKEESVGNCTLVRVNSKANALLEDVAKRSGRSKQYVASKMIEFAYDFIEYADEEKECNE